MKKLISLLLIVVMILTLSSCSNNKDLDNHFYIGRSYHWLATYTITKADGSYYDSLTIQYIFSEEDKSKQEIGTDQIEYQLTGKSIEIKSSFPQKLEGIGNFHTGGRANADYFKIDSDREMELTVKWNDTQETMKLKLE